ncbi:MAG: ribonuclease III [Oscillospiraceae bacterium]|nr:ribonuclease III [Oscillospiraceae bacterium]
MSKIEAGLGYEFKNKARLEQALTHSSYANEHGLGRTACNERLEFLGDSVLSTITSERLFAIRPRLPEGELTKRRAALVCESSLARFAGELDLGSHLLLGRGEEKGGGRERPSILADCFEAVVAAIYLDGGMEAARAFVERFICEDDADELRDFKTQLQEIVQQYPEERLSYEMVSESGPDHDKTFACEVRLNSNVIGRGTGRSKKQAEQAAAREALALMGL